MSSLDIVIATKDRPRALARCLEALTRQTMGDFGVIVVDDGSDPPVEAGLPPALREQLDLRVLRHPEARGPAGARNAGVAASGAELIVFLDDDVVADPALIDGHLAALASHEGRAATIGPLAAPPDWHGPAWNVWEARTLAREYARMERGEYRPTWRQFHTGNVLVRRADFLGAGGFDERFLRAEDIELALRMALDGVEFIFVPDAIGWHYAERSLDAWLRIPRAYARCDAAVDALHPIEWMRVVKRERTQRHLLSRLARHLLARPGVHAPAARGAALFAGVLHRLGLTSAAMRPLALAYDLEYEVSLREATARPTVEEMLRV